MDGSGHVGESEFCMWRAVFAFALAGQAHSLEKWNFLQNYKSRADFSHEQVSILKDDLKTPQSVTEMYNKIVLPHHRARFFELAEALSRFDNYNVPSFPRMAPHLYARYARAELTNYNKEQALLQVRV